MKPRSGWVRWCKYGRGVLQEDRHYIVYCDGGPLDKQYVTFHGEAPTYFVHPTGTEAHRYDREWESGDGNDAFYGWKGREFPR